MHAEPARLSAPQCARGRATPLFQADGGARWPADTLTMYLRAVYFSPQYRPTARAYCRDMPRLLRIEYYHTFRLIPTAPALALKSSPSHFGSMHIPSKASRPLFIGARTSRFSFNLPKNYHYQLLFIALIIIDSYFDDDDDIISGRRAAAAILLYAADLRASSLYLITQLGAIQPPCRRADFIHTMLIPGSGADRCMLIIIYACVLSLATLHAIARQADAGQRVRSKLSLSAAPFRAAKGRRGEKDMRCKAPLLYGPSTMNGFSP